MENIVKLHKVICSIFCIALFCLATNAQSPVEKTWEWTREDSAGWRAVADDVLELRAQKGRIWAGGGAKNLLVDPQAAAGRNVAVEVEHGAPKTKYEQGGLLVYRDDDHFVKLIVEFIDGGYFIVLAREIGGKGKVFTKIKIGDKGARIRLAVDGDKVTASFANRGSDDFKPAGECELPGAAAAHFALFTQDGSDEEVRWIRFSKVTTSKKAEPQKIFDGKTLTGWDGDETWWSVKEGAITGVIADGGKLRKNQFIYWDGELNDFELCLKYRITGHGSANSGIQIRSERLPDGHAKGYQADLDMGSTWVGRIYDEHGRALIGERGTRTIIDKTGNRDVQTFRKLSEFPGLVQKDAWNDYRIKAVGPRIWVWVNGELFTDLTDGEIGKQDFSGKLAMQLHSGRGPVKVEFKEITLTDLGKTALPEVAIVPGKSRAGISPKGKNLGFEKGTLEGWTATGNAWEGTPLRGDTVAPRRRGQTSGHDGTFWVGGFEFKHTDAAQGTLTSAKFMVTHPWASFLVGGGKSEKTRVEILDSASGKVVLSASGKNLETMTLAAVDLSRHLKKGIRVRLVDESSGPWGHLNFDDFRFHQAKPGAAPKKIAPAGHIAANPILKHLKPNPTAKNADSSIAGMWVPEGFKVELVAQNPGVTQPIAFTFDERGRIWVAEAHSYPRRQPEGKGKDRIIILEDSNGDGSFEKKTVFATGLNLVSGLEVGFGGVWVGAAPQLLFIPDKNRDDLPDGDPVVLLDGWGYADTHETLNSFAWGPDGWLYGNQGVFNISKIGKPGAAKKDRVKMRAGVWRYHPQRHEFEIFANGGSNQWGTDFNEMGHLFITHCRSAWGGGPTTYVVQGGHYWNQSNNFHAPFIASGVGVWTGRGEPVFRNYLLSSARYGHGEGGAGKAGSRALYGGHSQVGTMIYLGNNWPEKYRDQLFTHNLHGHQMNRQVNERSGSGYETKHAGTDHLYTPAPRFVGVDLKYGPDGAVYIIDWVDKQHCHTNNEEAWDRSDGRIFRMSWAETYRPVSIDLGKKTPAELLKLALSKDEWMSRTARRIVQERRTRTNENEKAVFDLAANENADAATVLRAMWVAHADGQDTTATAIQHPDENVRAWAIRLHDNQNLATAPLVDLAKTEPSAMVRLALASALPRLADDEPRWKIVEALAARAEDKDDAYLPKMIWYGLAPLSEKNSARALAIAQKTEMKMLADSIIWFLSRNAEARELITKYLEENDIPGVGHLLNLMASSLPGSGQRSAPQNWSTISAKLRTPATTPALDKLGGLFGDKSVFARMRKLVIDRTAPRKQRQAALDFLKNTGDSDCAAELLALLSESVFRGQVLPLFGRFDDESVATALVALLPELEGADRNAALGSLSSKPKLARALLNAMREKRADKSLLTSLHIRQMQNLGDAELNELITRAWGKLNETSADAKASIAKFKKLYNEAPRWSFKAAAGAATFTKLCATCHQMNGKGVALGPDLTGSHTNGVDYFIENIVDPNAVIGESFQLNVVTKKDGSVISGMPAKEDATTLTLRTLTESTDIPKSEIQSRQILDQSMMPPGLLSSLTEKEVIELLKFLTTKTK